MAPPKTALRHDKLTSLSKTDLPKSGHQVIQVSFVDFDGGEKKGFYKALDDTYPEILAKIAVATSVIMRMNLGARAAEDRLVYDDKGKIVGSLSIAIEGFKPFNYWSETLPSNPQEKEKVSPSVETLMQHNILELLLMSWFLGDDDLHPKNISLVGRIDWDMFFYAITEMIKGPRTVGNSPEGSLELSNKEWENFPCVTKPTHWPTKYIPDNYYVPKRYPNYNEFITLSENPSYEDALTGKTTAQEQIFTAALKALLTYQPDVLYKRLEDAIGLEPLNYSALESSKQKKLEEKFPKLFNLKADKEPFIQFMAVLYQSQYDELYRKVVFHRGCEKNSSGKPIPAFHQFLCQYPHAFKNIKKWVSEQNQILSDKLKQYRQLEQINSSELNDKTASASSLKEAVKSLNKNRHIDDNYLNRRYHTIWRNSYTLQIKNLLHEALSASTNLKINLSSAKRSDSLDAPNQTSENDKITQAWELLSSTYQPESRDALQSELECDENSEIGKAALKLNDLNHQFYQIAETYLTKPLNEITIFDNQSFIGALRELQIHYKNIIPEFYENTTWAKKCFFISQGLERFCGAADFYVHLYANQSSNQAVMALVPIRRQPHTDQDIVNECMVALFDWAKTRSPDELSQKIIRIIEADYSGSVLTNRKRAEPVKKYLLESRHIPGDTRLAYILSSGSKTGNGALNTLLVTSLIRDMVVSTQNDIHVYLPSVRAAIEANQFNTDFYTKNAIDYAKSNERFTHIYSNHALKAMNKTFYEWVNNINPPTLETCIKTSLKSYEKKISFFTPTRRGEVETFLRLSNNADTVASIFSNGGVEPTSLNTILFNSLLDMMKSEILSDKAKLEDPNYTLILQLASDEQHKANFMSSLKYFALLQRNSNDNARPLSAAL